MVWAHGAPADLRKGFDGLSALVTHTLERDPLSGDCYLFVNATRKRAKVLLWGGTGLCIYAKRLEQGRFACLWRDATARVVRLTVSELQLFLEGSTLVGRVALWPAPCDVGFSEKRLAPRRHAPPRRSATSPSGGTRPPPTPRHHKAAPTRRSAGKPAPGRRDARGRHPTASHDATAPMDPPPRSTAGRTGPTVVGKRSCSG